MTQRKRNWKKQDSTHHHHGKRRKTVEGTSLKVGMAGFLVSATINQEKRAASFILHRLMDILETHYSELLNTHFPSSSSSSSSSSTSNETTSSLVTKEDVTSHLDIEKEIAEEIQEHQSQVTTDAPFRLIPRLSNCLFFDWIDLLLFFF
ncbi:hypothetical protein HMI55_000512 [Coelomomyces lativittatus]|nr:hypothetical protein HMI55_000512 [Coelomomyces lativittatus]